MRMEKVFPGKQIFMSVLVGAIIYIIFYTRFPCTRVSYTQIRVCKVSYYSIEPCSKAHELSFQHIYEA